MAQVVLGPHPKLDSSVKKAAYSFLEKLQENDASPGLHIEPIVGTLDPRVRTGRVTDSYRAVLVKLQGQGGGATYVYLGTHSHDDAITFAKTASVQINPLNGVAELIRLTAPTLPTPVAAPETPDVPADAVDLPDVPAPSSGSQPDYPVLGSRGIGVNDLIGLGMARGFAEKAVKVRNEDALLELADQAPAAWQGVALLDLAFGSSVSDVRASLLLVPEDPEESALDDAALEATAAEGDEAEATADELIIQALQHPAARLEFAFVDEGEAGLEELRAAIEDDNFSRWRVFLHPQQRAYATRARNGAFRLSGGAGTGKTVVLLHRARHLLRADPDARIVLTTFTRTLAKSLDENLSLLDPHLARSPLGGAGVTVSGIDVLVRQVLKDGGGALASTSADAPGPVEGVLGARTASILDSTPEGAWKQAADSVPELPSHLRTETFLESEYAMVVLPNRITTLEAYLAVRRPGRGVPLTRATRRAVWSTVAAYRASAAAAGTTDWDEKAVIAAAHLDSIVGQGGARPADHVLVDEAQDLTPSRLLFLRALVSPGRNDLFLAEDAHQRIYGHKVVLSRFGINVRGRSRRLTLNYRTTAQNLAYAVGVLSGANFSDLDGQDATVDGYRSSRLGPVPVRLSFGSLTEEYDGIAHQVRSWLDADVTAETIGLLCSNTWAAERLVRMLGERDVRAKYVGPNATTGSGSVLIMTMHRAKGMEFSRVVLCGVGAAALGAGLAGDASDSEREEHELRERSLLYVAATRARDELVITWTGEVSPLLPAWRV